jgi:hypothetical protein
MFASLAAAAGHTKVFALAAIAKDLDFLLLAN